jgi:hypothetical protein
VLIISGGSTIERAETGRCVSRTRQAMTASAPAREGTTVAHDP